MMDYATPAAMVSAYCRAVFLKLIPHGFWGIGEIQTHNEKIFYRNVHRFIELRRFESLSLHHVLQGMKVSLKLPTLYSGRIELLDQGQCLYSF